MRSCIADNRVKLVAVRLQVLAVVCAMQDEGHPADYRPGCPFRICGEKLVSEW